MTVTISPAPLRGKVSIIPSKSHLHRLLICAAFSDRETYIRSAPTQAEDVAATVNCLVALGAKISRVTGGFQVTPVNLAALPNSATLPCGESGSTFRFMLPVVCALGVSAEFHMAGRLPERPLTPLTDQLQSHGITISRPRPEILCTNGMLIPGDFSIPGNISSQYVTGLLFALPLLARSSRLTVEGAIESENYISMTLQTLAEFGRQPDADKNSYHITGGCAFRSPGDMYAEGDWSNAAFWLCAGALHGGSLTVQGLSKSSLQGDKEVISILEKMGAKAQWHGDDVVVSENKRNAVEFDAAGIPDLVPILSLVAAVSDGRTVIKNAARLRMKESDRLASVTATLNALGAKVIEGSDSLSIDGVKSLKGGTVEAWGDHRIAMTAAIAACACENAVTIKGAQAVSKSYPQFFDELASLGAHIVSS